MTSNQLTTEGFPHMHMVWKTLSAVHFLGHSDHFLIICSIIFQSFSHHFPIIFPSWSRHFFTMFKSFSHHFQIIFPSWSHQFPTMFKSLSHHFAIICSVIFPPVSHHVPVILPLFPHEFTKTRRRWPPQRQRPSSYHSLVTSVETRRGISQPSGENDGKNHS